MLSKKAEVEMRAFRGKCVGWEESTRRIIIEL